METITGAGCSHTNPDQTCVICHPHGGWGGRTIQSPITTMSCTACAQKDKLIEQQQVFIGQLLDHQYQEKSP